MRELHSAITAASLLLGAACASVPVRELPDLPRMTVPRVGASSFETYITVYGESQNFNAKLPMGQFYLESRIDRKSRVVTTEIHASYTALLAAPDAIALWKSATDESATPLALTNGILSTGVYLMRCCSITEPFVVRVDDATIRKNGSGYAVKVVPTNVAARDPIILRITASQIAQQARVVDSVRASLK